MVGFQTPPPRPVSLQTFRFPGGNFSLTKTGRRGCFVALPAFSGTEHQGVPQEQRGGRGLCCLEDSFHLEVQTRDATNTATEYSGKGGKNDSAV